MYAQIWYWGASVRPIFLTSVFIDAYFYMFSFLLATNVTKVVKTYLKHIEFGHQETSYAWNPHKDGSRG